MRNRSKEDEVKEERGIEETEPKRGREVLWPNWRLLEPYVILGSYSLQYLNTVELDYPFPVLPEEKALSYSLHYAMVGSLTMDVRPKCSCARGPAVDFPFMEMEWSNTTQVN